MHTIIKINFFEITNVLFSGLYRNIDSNTLRCANDIQTSSHTYTCTIVCNAKRNKYFEL